MMSEELKLALQALGAISEKNTRVGSLKEVLRLYQKVQRIVFPCEDIACDIDSRNLCLRLSLYYYPGNRSFYAADFTFFYSLLTPFTSYRLKSDFFTGLKTFINNVKIYCYDKEANDPTRACILP